MPILSISVPEVFDLATRERDEASPRVQIPVSGIAPEVASEIFAYGLRVIINRAANTEENIPRAIAAAEAIASGQHWRNRAQGRGGNEIAKEARKMAEDILRKRKPAGIKMPDWLAREDVKAKIAEVAARESTLENAAKIVGMRKMERLIAAPTPGFEDALDF